MTFLKQKNNQDLDLDEKVFLIHLKNQLALTNLNVIKDTYSTKELYTQLLINIRFLFENDEDYFLFKDLIDRCQELINHGRFKYNINSEIRTAENEMILSFNKLSNMEKRQKLERKKAYILKELEIRSPEDYHRISKVFYYNLDAVNEYEDIVNLISSDSMLLYTLEQKQKNKETIINMAPLNFLSSARYLLEYIPELFIKNKDYIPMIQDYLDLIKFDESNIYRKNIKVIQKRLKYISK